MGNLRSVQKGFERVGSQAVVSRDVKDINSAEKLVLPGVGAFPECMKNLAKFGLVGPILDFVKSGRPFLGICLGLQLLFDTSYENGEHKGFGVFPGEVVRFQLPKGYSIPHMGWNQLIVRNRPPILEGIAEGTHFYFVHSYYVVPQDANIVAADTDYGGPFCSMIWHENVFATQFHPEKSQAAGLRILKNFAELDTSQIIANPKF